MGPLLLLPLLLAASCGELLLLLLLPARLRWKATGKESVDAAAPLPLALGTRDAASFASEDLQIAFEQKIDERCQNWEV